MNSDNQPMWRVALSGLQMLFVAFGALVLMPIITGLDPSVALFTAGIGTLIFQFVTKNKVPVFLASSFVFIAPIFAAKELYGIEATMGGLMAVGFVYVLLASLIALRGPAFINKIMPPVVTGPIIMVIGLTLAPVAVFMAIGKTGDGAVELFSYNQAIIVSMISLLVTVLVATMAKGIFRLLPILAGIIVGSIVAGFMGMLDFSSAGKAAWIAVPNFTFPAFHWEAILFLLPIAIAPAIEHVGDIAAIGGVTGKDYTKEPGLHRTLLGDGLATVAASALGGPPNTTYSEVTGAVLLTKAFNPVIMLWAALFAIILAFVAKFGAVLQSIPSPVMGGILVLLFGSIAAVGMNLLIKNKVDLSQQRNVVIVSTTLVFGIGGMALGMDGGFSLKGVSLAAVLAIVLNLILPPATEEETSAE